MDKEVTILFIHYIIKKETRIGLFLFIQFL